MGKWIPVKYRHQLRYVVERRVFSNAFGSGFEFAREAGQVRRFWTRKAAQDYADKLNAEEKSP